jgi:hypothetical protein
MKINNNILSDNPDNGIGGAKFVCNHGNLTILELHNNIINHMTIAGNTGVYTSTVVAHGNNIFGDPPDIGPPYPFVINDTEAISSNFDALFIDVDTDDFTLAADSLAINFGTSGYGPATDILGNSRVGLTDVGAYEYQVEQDPNNHAPVLNAVGNKTVKENRLLTFVVSGSDEDLDPLIYDCNMPSGASFSVDTFTWTPTYREAGEYGVTVSVTDGEKWDVENITITVTDAPQGVIF